MMKFDCRMFLFGVFLFCIPLMAFGIGLPKARITVRVVDEAGKPVSNAVAGIGFNQGGDGMTGRYEGENFKGLSDTNGLFSAEAKTIGMVGISVRKDGCYMSSKSMQIGIEGIRNGKWQPWNPTVEMILKTIDNPVPMYAKRVETHISATNQPFGYDLLKGDWVAPYGKGVVSDFVFQVEGYFNNARDNDSTLTLSFVNKNDGIIPLTTDYACGSTFRSCHTAPEQGYMPKKIWRKSRHQNPESDKRDIIVNDYEKDRYYIFRIRTVTNETGEIISAMYGKIYWDIEYGGASEKGCYLIIRAYYLNPDGTRNLEFDPERNLFGWSPRDRECVSEP